MPNVYVFPGGRVDRADSYARAADHLNSRTRNILEACMTPNKARATVLAAVRETFEETGFVIGEPTTEKLPRVKAASWNAFYKTGHLADLSEIHVIGRATTPPYRPKRFDTWFFMTRVSDDHAQRHFMDSDELLDTQWVPLKTARELKMHIITEMMLEVLETFLIADNPPSHVPFSRFKHGKFSFSNFP